MTLSADGRRLRRRQDGTRRPADARHRRKYQAKRFWRTHGHWLVSVDRSTLVFTHTIARRLSITEQEAAAKLESFAEKARWRKLRSKNTGALIAVAQPRKQEARKP